VDIQHVFQELQSASDFELFRLKVAVEKLLQDPDRVDTLRKKMTVGMQLEYFCEERNRSIRCSLLDIKRTRATVKELDTEKVWTLPFYYLNLDHIPTELTTNKKCGMSKAELYIGCRVGFISKRDNQEYIGKILKLNPKRALISIDNSTWTVPYMMLFPIINSELDDNHTLLLAE